MAETKIASGDAEMMKQIKYLIDDAGQSAELLADIKDLLTKAVAVLEQIRDRN